jgi:hypothetical protein
MITIRAAVIVAVVTCAACSGGGGGGTAAGTPPNPPGSPPPVAQQSAGGFWFALTGGATAMTLMIAETGEMRVTMPPSTSSSGPAFGSGAVLVTTNQVAGSFETRAVQPSPTSPVGAELDCTIDGTVTTRVAMQTTVVCTDTSGSSTTTDLNFYYDSRYDSDSSLTLIAGNYTLPLNASGNSLNINGDGTLFGMYQNGPRCTLNGRVTIVDTSFNLYRFEVLFSGCTVLTHLEGVTMTGFATRDLPGQKAGAFHLLLTAVVAGRLEFASVVYEPV